MSPYTLLQYLLGSSLEEISQTYFFFPVSLNCRLRDRFPFRHVFYYRKWCRWIKPLLWVYWYVLMRVKNLVWPFLLTAKIYAEDQQYFCWILLHGLKYTLLEDGTGTYFRPSISKRNIFQSVERWLFRPLSTSYWGQNENCVEIRLSCPSLMSDTSKVRRFDLQKEWRDSSTEKKSFIMSVYALTESVVAQWLVGKKDLILTQPYSELGVITEAEKIACYRKIIARYDLQPGSTLVKTHPQERTDYKKALPGYSVCAERIPVEFFALLGSSISRVFTLTSTGVFVFSGNAEIVWLGTTLSEAMRERYGDIPNPFAKMNVRS